MTTLALDGALGAFSAAIARDGAIAVQRSDDAHRALEGGLALVATVLQEAGVAGNEVERIAVGIGPGSFTGVRIALSYAKALAFAWRRPLVAISSYDIVEGGRDAGRALAVVRGRPDVVCARLRDARSVATACGQVPAVVDRLVGGDIPMLTLFGDAEDVREALAERGIVVQCFPPPPNAAAVAALLAPATLPVANLHGARPDYGELPAVTVRRKG